MKKTIILLIIITMVFQLVACSQPNNPSIADSENTAASQTKNEADEQFESTGLKQRINRICSGYSIAILNDDGTVKNGVLWTRYDENGKSGNNFIDYIVFSQIEEWKDIVNIKLSGKYIYGLTKDGDVYGTKSEGNDEYQTVKLLTDVVAFTTGGLGGFGRTLIGLKKDGTLVTTGPIQEGNVMQFDQGQNNVDDWTDVIAIDSGEYHTIGLRNDGTVLATGLNNKGQCAVSDWTDVCEIACGPYTTAGLKKDGSVLFTGNNEAFKEKLSSLNDVKSILVYNFSDCNNCVICLKNDGTVSVESDGLINYEEYLQDKISKWTDIVSIYFGHFPGNSEIVYGIKSDGTVVWEVYNEAIHEDVENMIQEFGGLSFD